jgi:hypothetical protein
MWYMNGGMKDGMEREAAGLGLCCDLVAWLGALAAVFGTRRVCDSHVPRAFHPAAAAPGSSKGAFRVVTDTYVTDDSGTGVVHQVRACVCTCACRVWVCVLMGVPVCMRVCVRALKCLSSIHSRSKHRACPSATRCSPDRTLVLLESYCRVSPSALLWTKHA